MSKIIDSHCHAWTYWPYQPPVPDPECRGKVEQLLNEMDRNGIDQALIVCAEIEHNPENNVYIANQIQQHFPRLHQLVDLDSKWSATYHQPGADKRIYQMAEKWPIKGFTHYIQEDEDGSWLYGPEGQKMFRAAEALNLIVSLSCLPHQQPAVRRIAEMFPQTPILCHHMGFVNSGNRILRENLQEVLTSAQHPNIYMKISGFAYAAEITWDYPYSGTQWIVEAIYDRFGPQRMCWGSDYPVVRFFMTYRQALETLRYHCKFISTQDQEWILGLTLDRLITSSGNKTA